MAKLVKCLYCLSENDVEKWHEESETFRPRTNCENCNAPLPKAQLTAGFQTNVHTDLAASTVALGEPGCGPSDYERLRELRRKRDQAAYACNYGDMSRLNLEIHKLNRIVKQGGSKTDVMVPSA